MMMNSQMITRMLFNPKGCKDFWNKCSTRNGVMTTVSRNFSVSKNMAAETGKKPILYSYFRSSAAWRVRIVLAYKGIEYDYRAVNLLSKEQFQPDFLKINPLGQVPVLIINHQTLFQSVAIMEYLEEVYPEKRLLPSDPSERAKVREVLETINSGIHPITNLSTILKYSENKEKQVEWLRYWGQRGFTALESILERTSGQFCVNDTITLADCTLVPQTANAIRWGVKMENFPKTLEIYNRLSTLEPFLTSHPSVQPDCPEKLR